MMEQLYVDICGTAHIQRNVKRQSHVKNAQSQYNFAFPFTDCLCETLCKTLFYKSVVAQRSKYYSMLGNIARTLCLKSNGTTNSFSILGVALNFASYSLFGKDVIWFLGHLVLFSNSIFPTLLKKDQNFMLGCLKM